MASGALAAVPAAGGDREQPAPAIAPTQQIATLGASHEVYATPGARHAIAVVPARAPITGGPTVLPVTGRATTTAAVRWLRVRVPGRPNGRQGWIVQRGVELATTRWHLVVRTSARRVLAYRNGRLMRTLAAVVGKPSTPTPRGEFLVEESVRVPPGSPGGPFALALSARSNVLQDFDGGPGQIGIHGVDDLGGMPGTAVSHGCVRLADGPIRWLAARIRPGVPVTITR
ncbi:MAG TPA: L,D-transpeptidase [Solirubrobacteraceae bacterium]